MEISGQYQYIRIYPGQGAPSSSCQGAGGTFAVSMNNWLGLVGDVGAAESPACRRAPRLMKSTTCSGRG